MKYRILISLVLALGVYGVAEANHAWGNYHWARTANPFTLKAGDNVSSVWDAYLATAASDWSNPGTTTVVDVLNVTVVPGLTNGTSGRLTPKNCVPTTGRVEVCNAKYGNNGWLGIASIWATGDHITQGTVKMNDTYFASSLYGYNTPAWRALVMCQEVGHTFGLDHQDEVFDNANLNTCMDYTNSPASNQHPNFHDYEELALIYAHLDAVTTIAQTTPARGAQDIDHNDRSTWGKEIRHSEDKHTSVFERDFGHGQKAFTFVTWAE